MKNRQVRSDKLPMGNAIHCFQKQKSKFCKGFINIVSEVKCFWSAGTRRLTIDGGYKQRKTKIEVTLEHVTRAQSGNRGIALHFL